MDNDKDGKGPHHCKYCDKHVKSYSRHKKSSKHRKNKEIYKRVLEYKLRKR